MLKELKTVSLFSGAGGMDLGFIKAGFDIIWANDIDKFAVKSYKENIGDHIIEGDITEIIEKDVNQIPNHDVLIAGFPCQPFSLMGKKKGFDDKRGTLFFSIKKILINKHPEIIVLENVRNLLSIENGKIYEKMIKELESPLLNYKTFTFVLNSKDYGVPQVRRRVFIVGFKNHDINIEKPKEIKSKHVLKDFLDKEVEGKYFLSEKILKTVLANGTKNYSAKPEIDLDIAKPLCATMHKMHRASQDNYVTDIYNRIKNKTLREDISPIRRLTPKECGRLQGFPIDKGFNINGKKIEKWKQVVSDTQSYIQFGNAVTTNVAYSVANQILDSIRVI